MKRNRRLTLALLGLVMMLAIPAIACGVGGGDAGPQPTGPPVRLINDGDETICYVYMSLSTEDTWGEVWLGDTEVVSTGDVRDFTMASGTYDLMAADCSNNEIDSRWGVNITGPYTWRVSN